jgi:hypothetical protein
MAIASIEKRIEDLYWLDTPTKFTAMEGRVYETKLKTIIQKIKDPEFNPVDKPNLITKINELEVEFNKEINILNETN